MKIIHRNKVKSTGKFAPTNTPYRSKKYKAAERIAGKKEKRKFGKHKYDTLNRIGYRLPRGELLAKVTKNKNILLSKKVPKSLEKNAIYHEKELLKAMKRE